MRTELATLKFLFECGISDILGDSPVNRMVKPEIKTHKATLQPRIEVVSSISTSASMPAFDVPDFKDVSTLSDLFSKIEGLDLPLQRTARSALFSDGSPKAEIVFLTAVPSLDDDRDGQLISGKTGVLWDAMLKAIDLSRGKTYTMTVSPFRPPAGRRLTKDEAVFFTALFKKHFSLLSPKMIVALGTRAEAFLNTCGLDLPVHVMPHPEDILKDASLKPKAWEVLKKIREDLSHANA